MSVVRMHGGAAEWGCPAGPGALVHSVSAVLELPMEA